MSNTSFRFGLLLVATAGSWKTYLTFVPPLESNWIVQSYLALIPLYLMGQTLSTLLELVFSATGWQYPAHFQYPFLAKSLTEFWGQRWASFVADWLNQMVFSRYRRQPTLGLVAAFFYSGLWHEILINVPLYLFFGTNLLGAQILYFLIQAVGIVGERKLVLSSLPALHGIYLWTVVLLPAPLVINEGVLRVTGLFNP